MNFSRAVLSKRRDKRKSCRYAVGPGFPLKGKVSLLGREQVDASAFRTGMAWSGPLSDMSDAGVRLMLPPSALAVRGETTTLHLSLGDFKLSIPCTVAYLRVYTGYAACGLALEFPDDLTRKSYLQLLESVAIGATFAPVASVRNLPRLPELVAEQYKSHDGTLLTVWRRTSNREPDSFEILAGDHCIRGESASPELMFFGRENPPQAAGRPLTAPRFGPVDNLHGELLQFFRCLVPNISKSVPRDLRGWLTAFAGKSGSTTSMEETRTTGFPTSASPSAWAPPQTKSRTRPPETSEEKLRLTGRGSSR